MCQNCRVHIASKRKYKNTFCFGKSGEEVIGGWRELHVEELHKLYSSPNIISVIKFRKMKCFKYKHTWER
jgi:hypothetical protein